MCLEYKTTIQITATPNEEAGMVDGTIKDLDENNTPNFCAKQVTKTMFTLAAIANKLNPMIVTEFPKYEGGYKTELTFEFIDDNINGDTVKIRAGANDSVGARFLKMLEKINTKDPEALEAFGFMPD